jgi:Pyruvate/2-oxoacid:ferredoxin oxidoreductase gamma subunit
VGANKNSIKIIGEDTNLDAQGYFVYDSKKSGSITVSHLRFGPTPINAPYLIGRDQATFVACHQFSFLERLDVLELAAPGATFLLNSPFGSEEVWQHLPRPVQAELIRKRLRLFVIDGNRVAREAGMGGRVARVAMGANDAHTLKAILEAEAFDGPSLVIAYSHCIAHGYDLRDGLQQQKKAVLSGYWPLYRFDPRLPQPLQLDSKAPTIPLEEYAYAEGRYRMLQQTNPERVEWLMEAAQNYVHARWARYEQLAAGQSARAGS